MDAIVFGDGTDDLYRYNRKQALLSFELKVRRYDEPMMLEK